jgi:hypothetical protein
MVVDFTSQCLLRSFGYFVRRVRGLTSSTWVIGSIDQQMVLAAKGLLLVFPRTGEEILWLTGFFISSDTSSFGGNR